MGHRRHAVLRLETVYLLAEPVGASSKALSDPFEANAALPNESGRLDTEVHRIEGAGTFSMHGSRFAL